MRRDTGNQDNIICVTCVQAQPLKWSRISPDKTGFHKPINRFGIFTQSQILKMK